MGIDLTFYFGAFLGTAATLCAAIPLGVREFRIRKRALEAKILSERSTGIQLCYSTVEALAFALDAGDPYNMGHVECVQRCAISLGRSLNLSEDNISALKIAALLHNIGRLGIPQHILHKTEGLTLEEQEKIRTHPVLSSRIIATIPFPWDVVSLVRHHAEHWNGEGYPDGLKGEEIPIGARILAVANSYSALMHPRPYRLAFSSEEALSEIEKRAGSQFDPAVVAAFRPMAAQLRIEQIGAVSPLPLQREARSALEDIASAQRETLTLHAITNSLAAEVHLEAMAETLMHQVRSLVGCDACALFLPEESSDFLHARAAVGINDRYLLGSLARVGTYLTGRAFFRGEIVNAAFHSDDLVLRNVSDVWVPFRSTLVMPLIAENECLGTINLYSEMPDAFGTDTQRVIKLVATQTAYALERAKQFSQVQESAYTDSLTGLRNNRYLREFLEKELNRSEREQTPLAVLNIDVDQFKPINDRYGHAAGDQTLKDIAEILQTHIRNYDLAARYAGDEFVIALTRTDRIAAEVVAIKLKRAVEKYAERIRYRDPSFPNMGISIGIALFPEDAYDLQGILCRSDGAMYADKQSRKCGRDAA